MTKLGDEIMPSKSMITVCIWADGTWLMLDEVEDHPYLSDDFEIADFWVEGGEDGEALEDALEDAVYEYVTYRVTLRKRTWTHDDLDIPW